MRERDSPSLNEIARGFLKIGATAYGGPATMGVMQAEFQGRRGWLTKPAFLEGLALVNMLPGATAVQLAIFLGYLRGGWRGGLVAGACFALPGFLIMLALTLAYTALGVSPILHGALYGLGPVVLGIFVVAVYRLGLNALRSRTHAVIAVAAAAGSVAAVMAVFLPSFVLMLAILPAFDRVRSLAWAKAAIQGIAPGVIGVMAVALTRLAPHAVPDLLALFALLATVVVMLAWRVAPVKLMLAGSMIGILRKGATS
jgi:chromate transporter